MDAVQEAVAVAVMRRAIHDGRARAVRIDAGLSQADVGEACGTTGAAVQRWETGARTPRGRAARRYARLLAELGLAAAEPTAA